MYTIKHTVNQPNSKNKKYKHMQKEEKLRIPYMRCDLQLSIRKNITLQT